MGGKTGILEFFLLRTFMVSPGPRMRIFYLECNSNIFPRELVLDFFCIIFKESVVLLEKWESGFLQSYYVFKNFMSYSIEKLTFCVCASFSAF